MNSWGTVQTPEAWLVYLSGTGAGRLKAWAELGQLIEKTPRGLFLQLGIPHITAMGFITGIGSRGYGG